MVHSSFGVYENGTCIAFSCYLVVIVNDDVWLLPNDSKCLATKCRWIVYECVCACMWKKIDSKIKFKIANKVLEKNWCFIGVKRMHKTIPNKENEQDNEKTNRETKSKRWNDSKTEEHSTKL